MKPFTPMFGYTTTPFPPLLQRQSFLPIDPFHQVFAHVPAFAVQQHADLSVSVPHSGLRDLSDAHPQSGPRILVTAIAERPPIQPGYPARSPLAHPVTAVQVLDHLPTPRGR
jgi:hypothetical protein